jgi:adenylate kinase family enzyme
MKKPIRKWVIVAILILFIAYSGFATYNWLEGERIESYTLNDAVYLSVAPLRELSAVGFDAEYLIESDATDELLRERITKYFFHASTLFYSSSMLHTLTDDEKYWLFERAMINLQSFFVGVSNDRPDDMKEILTTNLDTLKQMDDILEEILRIDNLTLADAEKLLELSGNLTAG